MMMSMFQEESGSKPSLRVCRICGEVAYTEEELENFVKSKRSKHGRMRVCKRCFNEVLMKDSWKKWRENLKEGSTWVTTLKGDKRYVTVHKGRQRLRSNVVLEQKLGRSLKRNEVAHHINGDTLDDRSENLQLMTRSEHSRYHRLTPECVATHPFYRSGSASLTWKGDEATPLTIRRREQLHRDYLRRKHARAERLY